MRAPTSSDVMFAERGAGRAAEAAQDAVTRIAQGELADAVELLEEAADRALAARERLLRRPAAEAVDDAFAED